MLVELMDLPTEDGIKLPAAYYPAIDRGDSPVDAVLIVPGSMRNFHLPLARAWAGRFATAGVPCLSMSTRGARRCLVQ